MLASGAESARPSLLQFANRCLIQPQVMDEIVQLGTHANLVSNNGIEKRESRTNCHVCHMNSIQIKSKDLVRRWVQPPHMVWPHSFQMTNALSPNLVDGW
jgi:hypothetical protein